MINIFSKVEFDEYMLMWKIKYVFFCFKVSFFFYGEGIIGGFFVEVGNKIRMVFFNSIEEILVSVLDRVK